jgi:hypothetical protein
MKGDLLTLNNKKKRKFVVYLMIAAMLASTIALGLSQFVK